MVKILAIDGSGSTSGCFSYWNKIGKIYEQYRGENIKIVMWDSYAENVTERDLLQAIRSNGWRDGGTSPSTLVKTILMFVKEEIELHLISDGQVDDDEVRRTEELLRDKEIKTAKIDFYNTGGTVNLSVSAPFTRKTEFVIKLDGEIIGQGNSKQEIEWEKYENYQDFLDNYETLKTIIVAQNLGKNNQTLRQKLLILQKKWLTQISKQEMCDLTGKLQQQLAEQNYETSLELCRNCLQFADLTQNKPKEIEKRVRELILACTSPNNYSFDLIKTSRYQRAESLEFPSTEELQKLETVDVSDQLFECPILFDQDYPVLLICRDSDKPLLSDVPTTIVDDISNCPLNILKYPSIVDQIISSFDHIVGCHYFSHSQSSDHSLISPYTRRPVLGALTCGNQEIFCKASDWTIAQLLFGGKLLGNADLWNLVFYDILKHHVSRLHESSFLTGFQQYLLYRLQNHTTSISLSGLPDFPLLRVPVSVSLWYIFSSTDLFSQSSNFKQERLREYCRVIRPIITGLDIVKYPYPKEKITYRATVLSIFNFLMSKKQEKDLWSDILRSQYQAFEYLPSVNRFVFLDGPIPDSPNQHLPVFFRSLSLSEIIYLFTLVDPSNKSSDISIPFTLPVNTLSHPYLPSSVINYTYPLDDNRPILTKICPSTMRPYSIDPQLHKHWKFCSEETNGPLSQQISCFSYYQKYVQQYSEFPSIDELIVFVYDKQRQKLCPKNTLPRQIRSYLSQVINIFSDAFLLYSQRYDSIITPSLFNSLVYQSMDPVKRSLIEQ